MDTEKQSYSIRMLENRDIPAILPVLRDSFSNYFIPMDLDMSKLLLMFHLYDIKTECSFVLENEKRIAAVMLVGRRGNTGRIGPMGVISSKQKFGLGENLIKHSLPILRQMGINKLILEVITENHPAIRLYEKCGFKKTGNLYSYEIDRDQLEKAEADIHNNIQSFCTKQLEPAKNQCEIETLLPDPDLPPSSAQWLNNYPWQRNWDTFIKLRNECDYFYSENESKHKLYLALWHKSIIFITGNPEVSKQNDANRQVLSMIKKALDQEPFLAFNNIREGEMFFDLNKTYGFKNYINQYEMELCL